MTVDAGYTCHPTSALALALRTFGVTACNCVSHVAHGNVRLHTYSILRAQPAHHFLRAHPRFPLTDAGRAWKPAPTVGIRLSPTLAPTPQSRRRAPRQLPFQGSRGVCGGLRRLLICSHDTDTEVFLSPVRGGVLDAPRLRDCRGGVVADVWRGRLHHVLYGAPVFVFCPTYAISRAPPAHHCYGRGGWLACRTHVVRHPTQGASRTPPPTVGARHTLLRVG